jgi:ferredoxin
MRVTVDRSLCEGNGQCEAFAPDLFRLDEHDISVFARDGQQLPSELEATVASAVEACPVGALLVDG